MSEIMKKEHPDLLAYWNPELDNGLEYSVEIYSAKEQCETCGAEGSYVLRDDPIVGLCRNCLNEAVPKSYLRIEVLPDNHNY